MLIESLEKKTKLAMFTVLLAVSASAVICGLCFYFCTQLVRDQQQQVYVLDGSIQGTTVAYFVSVTQWVLSSRKLVRTRVR